MSTEGTPLRVEDLEAMMGQPRDFQSPSAFLVVTPDFLSRFGHLPMRPDPDVQRPVFEPLFGPLAGLRVVTSALLPMQLEDKAPPSPRRRTLREGLDRLDAWLEAVPTSIGLTFFAFATLIAVWRAVAGDLL